MLKSGLYEFYIEQVTKRPQFLSTEEASHLFTSRPVVTWFHNGDKIQDNKKFQVSRHSSPPQQSLSSRKAFDFLKCLQKASSMRGYF